MRIKFGLQCLFPILFMFKVFKASFWHSMKYKPMHIPCTNPMHIPCTNPMHHQCTAQLAHWPRPQSDPTQHTREWTTQYCCYAFFLNVGFPKEDIFLTTFYGLYFNQQVHITDYNSCFASEGGTYIFTLFWMLDMQSPNMDPAWSFKFWKTFLEILIC